MSTIELDCIDEAYAEFCNHVNIRPRTADFAESSYRYLLRKEDWEGFDLASYIHLFEVRDNQDLWWSFSQFVSAEYEATHSDWSTDFLTKIKEVNEYVPKAFSGI